MARKSGPRAQPASERQSGSQLPLRFGGDPLLWAAWLYYEEGMTQGDIAVAMGISRPTVNSYLADARTRGIVSIEIAPEKFRQLSLAQSLKEHFGLADCLVIPSTGGERTLTERLGAAGAQVLALHAQSGDTIAVTWGRTMLAIANAVERVNLRDMRVVQATGGTTAKIPWTPEACATRLAEALDARCIPLSSPAILSSASVRDVLFEEPVIAEQLGVLAAANRILLGISSLRAESTIHTSGFFDKGDGNEHYHAAVGSIAGRLINARGEPVAGPLDGRTVGIELAALRA
ncbi:MAG: sugar-binding domain-containing protein, partial [Martelella sp.]